MAESQEFPDVAHVILGTDPSCMVQDEAGDNKDVVINTSFLAFPILLCECYHCMGFTRPINISAFKVKLK